MNTPYAKSVFTWLRANMPPRALASLTSGDVSALQAAVQLVPLWSRYDNADDIAAAFGAVVRRMQPQCQQFAFHAIAHVYDWNDRFMLWKAAGFTELPRPCWECKYGPKPSEVAP